MLNWLQELVHRLRFGALVDKCADATAAFTRQTKATLVMQELDAYNKTGVLTVKQVAYVYAAMGGTSILAGGYRKSRMVLLNKGICTMARTLDLDLEWQNFLKERGLDDAYPVPHPYMEASRAFHRTDDKWVGEYGEERLRLFKRFLVSLEN